MARPADTGVSPGDHDMVSFGAEKDIPRRVLDEKDAVLSAFRSWLPGLVRLLANRGLNLRVAVCSQQIQDYHVSVVTSQNCSSLQVGCCHIKWLLHSDNGVESRALPPTVTNDWAWGAL